jgi:hypothetical protein
LREEINVCPRRDYTLAREIIPIQTNVAMGGYARKWNSQNFLKNRKKTWKPLKSALNMVYIMLLQIVLISQKIAFRQIAKAQAVVEVIRRELNK